MSLAFCNPGPIPVATRGHQRAAPSMGHCSRRLELGRGTPFRDWHPLILTYLPGRWVLPSWGGAQAGEAKARVPATASHLGASRTCCM